jgi:hypothetical protein
MRSLLQEIRYGSRLFVKQPGFTLLVVTKLMLEIAADVRCSATLTPFYCCLEIRSRRSNGAVRYLRP